MRICHLSSHIYDPCDDCNGCVCVHSWDNYEMPRTPLIGVVPGSLKDTQAFRDHMNWDRDLESYAGARKNGLQPNGTTRAKVESMEQQAESQQRAIDTLNSQGDMDTTQLKTVKGVHN